MDTNGRLPDQQTLQEALSAALPIGFTCNARYIHTPPTPCDPIFSPLPGHEPEKTRLASHFLSISIHPENAGHIPDDSEVIAFAIEVFIYSTKHLTTIFVSKADSTGYLPPRRPSPVKLVATTFLKWLTEQQRMKTPHRTVVISLFARSQNQYLFPGSIDHGKKHVLDDRQLIKWWARVLDPLFQRSAATSEQDTYDGYITVPGYDKSETARLFAPAGSYYGADARWKSGNPLLEFARIRRTPEYAPTRSLLPRFPDDPKARFMNDLDDEVGLIEESRTTISPSKRKNGRWKSVNDLERFWEAMEFRQECSSGRVVGFLWVVVRPPPSTTITGSDTLSQDVDSGESQFSHGSSTGDSQESATSATSNASNAARKRKRKRLTGPIVSRKPRLKGDPSSISATSEPRSHQNGETSGAILLGQEGYDKAVQTLLRLDFSSLDTAAQSTKKWINEVLSLGSIHGWSIPIVGKVNLEKAASAVSSNGVNSQVNDLGSMIRKKRKSGDTDDAPLANSDQMGGLKTEATPDEPKVNVLGAGMIRKKAKK